MSDRYGHKDYQNKVLESLARYLRRCRELNNPDQAFVEITGQLWGAGHPYNRIHELPSKTPGGVGDRSRQFRNARRVSRTAIGGRLTPTDAALAVVVEFPPPLWAMLRRARSVIRSFSLTS